ncbi:MAG TPA: MerR family transcriptional regulator [Thermoanaerobaculia bacterium]
MTAEAPERRTYKIGEVCRVADLQPYVLRYWETEFSVLAPNKSGGGQRLYSQREIDIILRIKQLLYTEGFTIAGAKKRLEGELDGNLTLVPATPADAGEALDPATPLANDAKKVIAEARRELEKILEMLT